METIELTVTDPAGLHARPAGMLVKCAQALESDVSVECNGKRADLKRLIAVMSLGAKCGDVLKITLSGATEKQDREKLEGTRLLSFSRKRK